MYIVNSVSIETTRNLLSCKNYILWRTDRGRGSPSVRCAGSRFDCVIAEHVRFSCARVVWFGCEGVNARRRWMEEATHVGRSWGRTVQPGGAGAPLSCGQAKRMDVTGLAAARNVEKVRNNPRTATAAGGQRRHVRRNCC